MTETGFLHLGDYRFAIDTATFRHVTDSDSLPGWDFLFSGPCLNDNAEEPLFPFGAKLLAEASPIPLQDDDDLSGQSLFLELPYDDDSGEPYFGINVCEEHDLSQLTLEVLDRDADRYLIAISATSAPTITGKPEAVTMRAWATRRAKCSYPA